LVAYYRDCVAAESRLDLHLGPAGATAAEPAVMARGVLADLDELAAAPRSRLRGGPLGVLLGEHRAGPLPDARPVPILLPSNVGQDAALAAALAARLTVVTGPPGTGKSQVLVNAVAATVLGGQTVLFASRTNRAVDVVFDRLGRLPDGLPVRAGRAARRAEAAARVRTALEEPGRSPGSSRSVEEAWAALARQLDPLYREWADRRRRHADLLSTRDQADQLAAAWRWDLPASAPPAVLRDAAARARAVAQTAASLACLPPGDALRGRLASFQGERQRIGRALWQARWAVLGGHAPEPARTAAGAVACQLERGAPPSSAAGLFRLALTAFPVWGLTSLATAACLPLAPALFDLVIVDEASQCDVASGLPLLARARRALIIGDGQQLGHVSRLNPETEETIVRARALEPGLVATVSQRRRSLYDVACARAGHPPLLLEEHYRCHPKIISFSNSRLYFGRLIVRTEPVPGGGLLWRHVAGSFRRGPDGRSVRNQEEAAAVVAQLRTELRTHPAASIGVVAPFRAQVELIGELAAAGNGRLERRLDQVTIDTVHRFQGDERDIMLLSPTVSAAMPAFFRQVAGQPRLLNVAVTRARFRLITIGDRDACLATGGMLAELAADAEAITAEPDPSLPAGDRRRTRPAPARPSSPHC
jgi:hypothetical protein